MKNKILIKTSNDDLLNLNDKHYYATLEEQSLILTPASKKGQKKYRLNWWTILLAILVTLLGMGFFYYQQKRQIPLTGTDSIASVVEILGVASGTICFLIGFWSQNQKMYKNKLRLVTLGLSFVLIAEFGTVLLARMLGELFLKSTFDFVTSSLLLFIFTLIVNSTMWMIGEKLSLKRLIIILSVVILAGTFTAMLINGNDYWWQNNFSFLGTTDAANRWQFNLTLILSAVLLVVLINTLFTDLYDKFDRRNRLFILNILLLSIAVNLGAVGLFPYSQGKIGGIHNFVAQNLVIFILILIIGIKWLLPVKNKDFYRFSIFIALGLILTSYLFYGIHYFSLTAFELFSFIFAFWWLLSLLNVLVDAVDQELVYEIEVKFNDDQEINDKV